MISEPEWSKELRLEMRELVNERIHRNVLIEKRLEVVDSYIRSKPAGFCFTLVQLNKSLRKNHGITVNGHNILKKYVNARILRIVSNNSKQGRIYEVCIIKTDLIG